MDTFEAIHKRRSIRKFANRPVSDDMVKTLLDAARWAPSACNKQLWEFVVVRDFEVKEKLALDGIVLPLSIMSAPIVIAVFYDCGKDSSPLGESIQSAAASIQNINLAATSLGLGTLWMCGITSSDKVKTVLNVPDFLTLIALVCIGYPEDEPIPPPRRSLSSMVHWDSFSRKNSFFPDVLNPNMWSITELKEFRKRLLFSQGVFSEKEPKPYRPDINLGINMLDLACRDIDQSISSRTSKSRILDILPYGGDYLIGMLNRLQNRSLVSVFELSDEDVDYITHRVKMLSLYEKITFLLAKAHNTWEIPVGDKSYQYVTCFFRLNMVPNPKELLSEMARVMDQSGKMIIALTNSCSLSSLNLRYRKRNKLKKLSDTRYAEIGPFSPISVFTIRTWLRKQGINIIDVYGLHPLRCYFRRILMSLYLRLGLIDRYGFHISTSLGSVNPDHGFISLFSSSVLIIARKSRSSGL